MTGKYVLTVAKFTILTTAIAFLVLASVFALMNGRSFDENNPETYNSYATEVGCTNTQLFRGEEGEYVDSVCLKPDEIERAKAYAVEQRTQGFFEIFMVRAFLLMAIVTGLVFGLLEARDLYKKQQEDNLFV